MLYFKYIVCSRTHKQIHLSLWYSPWHSTLNIASEIRHLSIRRIRKICAALSKYIHFTWWGHQIEAISALLPICAVNSPVTGEFPVQRPVTRSFDVFCDLRLNGRLSKQWWSWWFETPSRPLWRHSNELKSISHNCATHIPWAMLHI